MSCPLEVGTGRNTPNCMEESGVGGAARCSMTERRPVAENKRRPLMSMERPEAWKKSAPRIDLSTAARMKVWGPKSWPSSTTGKVLVPQAGMQEPLAAERNDSGGEDNDVGMTETCAPESTR